MRAQLLEKHGSSGNSSGLTNIPPWGSSGSSDDGLAIDFGDEAEEIEEGEDEDEDEAPGKELPLRQGSVVGQSPRGMMSGLAVEQTAWSIARLGVDPPEDWAALFLATSFEVMPRLR